MPMLLTDPKELQRSSHLDQREVRSRLSNTDGHAYMPAQQSWTEMVKDVSVSTRLSLLKVQSHTMLHSHHDTHVPMTSYPPPTMDVPLHS